MERASTHATGEPSREGWRRVQTLQAFARFAMAAMSATLLTLALLCVVCEGGRGGGGGGGGGSGGGGGGGASRAATLALPSSRRPDSVSPTSTARFVARLDALEAEVASLRKEREVVRLGSNQRATGGGATGSTGTRGASGCAKHVPLCPRALRGVPACACPLLCITLCHPLCWPRDGHLSGR
jgi:hypothetical protein